jgi:hypothetical protein
MVVQIPKLVLGYSEFLDPLRMRASLSRVLGDFPSFGGRFATKNQELYIKRGFGALLEVAESAETSASLHELVRNGHSRLLCPQLSMIGCTSGRSPLFAARITQTATGSILGITWNHALCDIPSIVLMLHAWSQAYRGEPYKKPLDVADRGAYLEEHVPVSHTKSERWRVLTWPDFLRSLKARAPRDVRRVFVDFSWSQVSAIHAAGSRLRPVSPGDALTAHILWRLCRLSSDVSPFLWMAMNYRKKFGLPANLVGNYADFVAVRPAASDGPAEIAAQLRSAIESFDASMLTSRELLKFKSSRSLLRDMMRVSPLAEPGRLTVGLSNVSRSGQDRIAFETARPEFTYVRMGDLPIPGVCALAASPNSAGITLDIVLPSKLAEQVSRDFFSAPE